VTAPRLKVLIPHGLELEEMGAPASIDANFYEPGDPWPPGPRSTSPTLSRSRRGHPLWSAPGLLLTPHVAGSTTEAWDRAWAVAVRHIEVYAGGGHPPNLVAGPGAPTGSS
jgi:lactate dehydrogenase-like 2-hydroxyacid dehydrogenase